MKITEYTAKYFREYYPKCFLFNYKKRVFIIGFNQNFSLNVKNKYNLRVISEFDATSSVYTNNFKEFIKSLWYYLRKNV